MFPSVKNTKATKTKAKPKKKVVTVEGMRIGFRIKTQ
jgi:hypothetical protein